MVIKWGPEMDQMVSISLNDFIISATFSIVEANPLFTTAIHEDPWNCKSSCEHWYRSNCERLAYAISPFPQLNLSIDWIVIASEHETPSRCAITQHMAKIRHIAKDKGFNISFSVSNPRNPKSTGDSKTSAPRIDSSPTPRKNGQSKGRNELAKAVKRNRKALYVLLRLPPTRSLHPVFNLRGTLLTNCHYPAPTHPPTKTTRTHLIRNLAPRPRPTPLSKLKRTTPATMKSLPKRSLASCLITAPNLPFTAIWAAAPSKPPIPMTLSPHMKKRLLKSLARDMYLMASQQLTDWHDEGAKNWGSLFVAAHSCKPLAWNMF